MAELPAADTPNAGKTYKLLADDVVTVVAAVAAVL